MRSLFYSLFLFLFCCGQSFFQGASSGSPSWLALAQAQGRVNPAINPLAFPDLINSAHRQPVVDVQQGGTEINDASARAGMMESFGRLPLAFEANAGQVDATVKYLSRGRGYTLFLAAGEAVLSLQASRADKGRRVGGREAEVAESAPAPAAAVRTKFVGSLGDARYEGEEMLEGKSNYFLGNDPAQWHTDVPNYGKVRCRGVYPGVDLVYYGNQGQIEYDFIVSPGADPRAIRLGFDGIRDLQVDTNGDLNLGVEGGWLLQRKPAIYQEREGRRQEIEGGYVVRGSREVGFQLRGYDAKRPLIIDPVLVYSTYLGGSAMDQGRDIAVDSARNVYVVGTTNSTNFPSAVVLGNSVPGNTDVFIVKINAAGTALVFSAIIGGDALDLPRGIVVDPANGNVWVAGRTNSSVNFPLVGNGGVQPQGYGGGSQDCFVSKLNSTGSALLFSSYLGGSLSEYGGAIALDGQGNAYISGDTYSADFPTKTPYQGTRPGPDNSFVTKINAAATQIVYSTYLGGTGTDIAYSIAVTSAGSAYVTGVTYSANFPTLNPLQAAYGGGGDAFVTKLNTAGTGLVYSTYLGGTGFEDGMDIAVDTAGNAYVTGSTSSTNFPTSSALQITYGGGGDAFVTKISTTGALVYSTYLGGSGSDYGSQIAVDSGFNAYVIGGTWSFNFPIVRALQPFLAGGLDAFITKLNAAGTGLVYSTYLGGAGNEATSAGDDRTAGIAVDSAGNAYVTGDTTSVDYPLSNPLQLTGTQEAFVAKISALLPGSLRANMVDYDGDSTTDITIWRPNTGQWWIRNSKAPPQIVTNAMWGLSTDIPVTGDYDGDGKTDIAVWRPSTGEWFIWRSSTPGTYTYAKWGQSTDIPVPGDYDGDGKTDIAIYRPSTSAWYIIPSGNPSHPMYTQWGTTGDKPVPGDYDGDGKTDIAIYRPTTGWWFIIPTSNPSSYIYDTQWGITGDQPVPGDYDGDGKTDIAVYRPTTGQWYIIPSSSPGSYIYNTQWGLTGDQPAPGDYDGDGKMDIAVYRPTTGEWFIIPSSNRGTYIYTQLGVATDIPITSVMLIR